MKYEYDFDPPHGKRTLIRDSREEAKAFLTMIFSVACRERSPASPVAIVLFERGTETWRHTRADQQQIPKAPS